MSVSGHFEELLSQKFQFLQTAQLIPLFIDLCSYNSNTRKLSTTWQNLQNENFKNRLTIGPTIGIFKFDSFGPTKKSFERLQNLRKK